MKIQLVRHATLVVQTGGINILVDPMLAEKESRPGVKNAKNDKKNPLVDLPYTPETLEKLFHTIDLVLITHTHFDHFDEAAAALIPKKIPVIYQPGNEEKIRAAQFETATPLEDTMNWRDINITRTGGRHGSLLTAKTLGAVSGYIIDAPGEPKLYIAGDTVLCCAVEKAMAAHNPDIVVVNAGAAQFLVGGPITMDQDDVTKLCYNYPDARIVAVHMEAINHCELSRKQLRSYLETKGVSSQVTIPSDGEWLEF